MLYLALAITSFRRTMTYRAATLAGLVTNFFFGLVRVFVFVALFESARQARVAGYSLQNAVTYVVLGQFMIAPLLIFGSYDISITIRTGDIAGDLARPMDFYFFWLARDLGRAAFSLLGRSVPLLIFYPLFFELTWPSSPARWAAFALSIFLAVLVSFSWRFLVNCAAFWTVDARGVARMAFLGSFLFTGLVLPLAFFPDGLVPWLRLLPFAAYINTPAEVFMGVVPDNGLAVALAQQLAWAVALGVAARAVFAAGVRHLTVQGG